MTFPERSRGWLRWLLAAMLLGSVAIVLPPAAEPFMLPKATFLVAAAAAMSGVLAARAIWSRRLHVPSSPIPLAVAAFGAALLVTTATSGQPWTSLVGFYGRYSGLALYLVYALVFVVTLREAGPALLRLLGRTAVVALGLSVGYGLLQAAGLEPVGYQDNGLGTTFSFFGNVNFGAAWVGAVTAVAVAVAASPAEPRPWRLCAAALVPLSVLYTLLTDTFQGPLVIAAALGWVGLVLATTHSGRARQLVRQQRGRVLVAGAAAGGAIAAAGWLSRRSLRPQLDQGLAERTQFWEAALGIFVDHPLIGTGLDTFGHHFLAYRPASHALLNGLAGTDAAHSVPLGMFSNGGVVLGGTYLAFVVLVGLALVRGLRRVTGPGRIPLAGWGGVWIGYQLQSLISLDVPPLALLHWLSAAVIVGLVSPPSWRMLSLPGAPAPVRAHRRGVPRRTAAPVSTRVGVAAAVVLAAASLWFAVYPLRADLAAASAAPLAREGQLDDAIAGFGRAADLNPGEASYPFLVAGAHAASGRTDLAVRAAREAADRDPGAVQYPLFAAQQARERAQGLAIDLYREAVERDPVDPPVLKEAAGYLLTAGEAREAERLLDRSVALLSDAATLVLLAEARLAQQDREGARAAAEQALELDPSSAPAQRLLERLG